MALNDYSALSHCTDEQLQYLDTQLEEVPDLYSLKILLHTQGLGLKRKGATVTIEQVWKKAPLIQIPLGIGHNPDRERRDGKITTETHCTDTNTYEVATLNENLKQLIREEAEKAQKDGRLRKIIIFDTPQAVSNYLHFTSTPNLLLCPHEYIQNQATHHGRSIEDEAHLVATRIGKIEKLKIQAFIAKNKLQNLQVITFAEIETTSLYQALENKILELIAQDSRLSNQLLNSVGESHLHKAEIGTDRGEPNHPNKIYIREQLALYAIKAVTLYIFNLGDTMIHSGETKNVRLTKAILKNKKYREEIHKIFNESSPIQISDSQLLDLADNGFVANELLQKAY
jgi:plasmid stability protein